MNIRLFLAVIFVTTSVQAQKAGEIRIEPYVFETNSGKKIEAEFGRILVPEKHSNPKGEMIELAFVRFKSTASTSKFPIVYLAGGPGGSGISLAKGPRFPLFMAMREAGDVIALDQRGTGLSKPNLACQEKLMYPLEKIGTKSDLLALYSERSRSCAESWRKAGTDLTAYNTNENAEDIELLRRSLGAEKFVLWGGSYGSHLALAFIRRHEKSVERAILSGIEGFNDTFKLPSRFDRQLELVNQLVKNDPQLSDKIPDFVVLVKRVLNKLDKQPVEIVTQYGKVKIGKFDLQQITIAGLGDRAGKEALPALFNSLDKNDLSYFLVKYVAQLVAEQRRDSIGSAMAFATDCASFGSKSRLRLIAREGQRSILGDSPDFPFPYVCQAWGKLDLGNSFRTPFRSKVKILFFSGTLDGKTPPGNIDAILQNLPNSIHVLIDGAGHGNELFISSTKIKDVMLNFMRDQPITDKIIRLPKFKFQQVI